MTNTTTKPAFNLIPWDDVRDDGTAGVYRIEGTDTYVCRLSSKREPGWVTDADGYETIYPTPEAAAEAVLR